MTKNDVESTIEEVTKIFNRKEKRLEEVYDRIFEDTHNQHSRVIEKKELLREKKDEIRKRIAIITHEITERNKLYIEDSEDFSTEYIFAIRDRDIYKFNSTELVPLERIFEEEYFDIVVEKIIDNCRQEEHINKFKDTMKYSMKKMRSLDNKKYLYTKKAAKIPDEYKLRSVNSSDNDKDYYVSYCINKENSKSRVGTIKVFGGCYKSKEEAESELEDNRYMIIRKSPPTSIQDRFDKRVHHSKVVRELVKRAEKNLDRRIDISEKILEKIDEEFERIIIASEI